jgi:UDP-glucose 4-epimerase
MGIAILDYLKDSGAHFIVFSRDEEKQHSLAVQHQKDWPDVEYVIGDVRDKKALYNTMKKGIDYVLHLAALKHIATGELFPNEAIETNLIGTRNVVEVAELCRARRLLNWSTDKAVYAINTYGLVKAIGERVVATHEGDMICMSVRYGNVLGSRGSVIPLWLDKIRNSEPLPITDYRMSRFLLTTHEAVLLSVHALCRGEHGDLFVMKPKASSIADMVGAIELHFGQQFSKVEIGIRPSEKLFEVLMTSEEAARSDKDIIGGVTYVRIRANTNRNYFSKGELRDEPKDFTSLDAEQLDAGQVLAKLKEAKLL